VLKRSHNVSSGTAGLLAAQFFSSSPFHREGIEVRLRLADGMGIQHFNSGVAYSMMQPSDESAARQPHTSMTAT
jgi:hypothetical protein